MNYQVSVDIYPIKTVSGWSNVYHIGKGLNLDNYGDRNPAIFFISGTTEMHIASSINGNKNYVYDSQPIPLKEWTTVSVKQEKK